MIWWRASVKSGMLNREGLVILPLCHDLPLMRESVDFLLRQISDLLA